MSIGIWQIALIVVVVLLLFGAGKLPRLMGDFAKGIKSFKAGIQDGEAPPATNQQNASASEAPADESKAIEKEGVTTAAESAAAKKDETAKS